MIYENIVELCAKRNISIRALEAKAGLGNGTIGRWRSKEPRVDNVRAVAKALGVSVSTILKEKKNDTKRN